MIRDLKWSPSDKNAARRAFNLALDRELHELIRETKAKAAKVEEASQLWRLDDWLGKRRAEIDRKYDYRYSVLPFVLATLLSEGWIVNEDLQGLDTAKLDIIRSLALPT